MRRCSSRCGRKRLATINLLSVQGGQHSFIIGAGRVPEVYDAIREMGEWLRRELLLRAAP
jgi:monoterpene epsilon-lactone hydrolase